MPNERIIERKVVWDDLSLPLKLAVIGGMCYFLWISFLVIMFILGMIAGLVGLM